MIASLTAFSSLVCAIFGVIVLPKTKRTLLLVLASGVCFTVVLFIYLALSAGSNIRAGYGMARIFLLFCLPLFFPILVAIGFVVRLVVELAARRKIPYRDFLPWGFPVLVGIAGIVTVFPLHSSAVVYRDLVSDQVPGSLSDFHYWTQMLPGDDLFVARFKVDPSEFDKVIARHKFEKISDTEQIKSKLQEFFNADGTPRANGLDISLPKSRIVRMYCYEMDDAGLPHIMNVFTNEARDSVVVTGDN